jgi:hypothetical protein
MIQQRLNLHAALTSLATQAWTVLLDFYRIFQVDRTRPYRPEAYYMRGPRPSVASEARSWSPQQALATGLNSALFGDYDCAGVVELCCPVRITPAGLTFLVVSGF